MEIYGLLLVFVVLLGLAIVVFLVSFSLLLLQAQSVLKSLRIGDSDVSNLGNRLFNFTENSG